jgi:hypothetical protein
VKRIVWILAGALVGLSLASGLQSALDGHAPRADWTRTAVVTATSGLTADYPQGWHAHAYGDDDDSLVIASFPLSPDWPTNIPAEGVYIWVFTYGAIWPSATADFPVRPAHFRLAKDDYGFYGCAFNLPGYALRFRMKGMAVQAMVALGEGARAEDALTVLDRLRISGVRASLAAA